MDLNSVPCNQLIMVDPGEDPLELAPSQYEVWRKLYFAEQSRIYDALCSHSLCKKINRIEHIGSTAVRDLAAKDIIDINIVVPDGMVSTISEILERESGATCIENNSKWHTLYYQHDGQRFNEHVFSYNSNNWKASVMTRETLRLDHKIRRQYEEVKYNAISNSTTLAEYSEKKSSIIQKMVKKAASDERLSFSFESLPEQHDYQSRKSV